MKKSILVVSLSLACAILANAQKAETRATGDAVNQTSAGVNSEEKSISLDSGTRLSGELQNAVDVRKARVGDRVVLKTTQAIKSGGRTVVGKGAKLIGHVTEVAQKTKGESQSRVGILFDRLEQGSLAVPISATISSITNGSATVRRNDEDVFATGASSSARSSSSTSAAAGGGLLGGTGGVINSTTSTVGNVVGGTTSAVGSTVNSTTNVVGSTAAGVGRTLGRIQISESTSTSVEGGSVLSLQGENLRLEKGTNFNLILTQSASAGTAKKQ
ncbi:MAG TPA: hypothetical protein VNO50_06520 [Pyrinomonadaceae bacterium]|nr:hypothetical protein [Pyrinomonadaceae bacterium]